MHETYFGRKSVPINVNLDRYFYMQKGNHSHGVVFFYIIDNVDMF